MATVIKRNPVAVVVIAILVALGAAVFFAEQPAQITPDSLHTLVLPAQCVAPACGIGFNVTVPHFEFIRVTYNATNSVSPELDMRNSSGLWNSLTKLPSSFSGSVSSGFCSTGDARVWFSNESPVAQQTTITASVHATITNSTWCG